MNLATSIPTDKNGNVYHGSRTFAEAEQAIDEGGDPATIADRMERAGYTGVAARIRREYEVD